MMWPGLSNHCKKYCWKCKNCQKNKKHWDKYSHLPPKEAETTLWKTVCVDCAGPYTIINKGIIYTITAMTMIDPVSSWFEIALVPVYQYNDPKKKEPEMCTTMTSAQISQLFNNDWLSHYPHPKYIIYNNGSKFKLYVKSLIFK
eukprot:8646643-Ditylum_brightwellii.AAC.1